jgi:hypothetical protein
MIAKIVSVALAAFLSILPVQAASHSGNAPSSPPGRGPAGMATGGVWYMAAELDRHISFTANEERGNSPAKGNLHYADANNAWYNADISAVAIDGNMAYFAGEVTSASNSSWVGNWISFAVKDGGTPGSNGDMVWGIFTDETTAMANVSGEITPGDGYAVYRGNLVVHSFPAYGRFGQPTLIPQDVIPNPVVPKGPPAWSRGKGH